MRGNLDLHLTSWVSHFYQISQIIATEAGIRGQQHVVRHFFALASLRSGPQAGPQFGFAVIGSLHYVVICSQLATNVAVNTLRCHLLYKVGAEERISDCGFKGE